MKERAPRNRTITLTEEDRLVLGSGLMPVSQEACAACREDCILWGDALAALRLLPSSSVDLLIADPPYNMTKSYNGKLFRKSSADEYEVWLRQWVSLLPRILKPTASLYVCAEWQSSGVVERVLRDYFIIHNRITWEREKGRGARTNWKNASEDIWFCSVSSEYNFNLEAVRLKKRVIAPYRDVSGDPKDWAEQNGQKFRDTAPSNLWTDLSVPFWSMPENTDHPTQKPEKLVAKLILASSSPGDLVLDPFLGSGTTAVAARKLGRHFLGIEQEREYCLLALKRLEMAKKNQSIQGFHDGCFWERNSGNH